MRPLVERVVEIAFNDPLTTLGFWFPAVVAHLRSGRVVLLNLEGLLFHL